MEQRSERGPGSARVTESSGRSVRIPSPILFATYAGRRADLGEWLKDAEINTRQICGMQYLAGLGVDLDDSVADL